MTAGRSGGKIEHDRRHLGIGRRPQPLICGRRREEERPQIELRFLRRPRMQPGRDRRRNPPQKSCRVSRVAGNKIARILKNMNPSPRRLPFPSKLGFMAVIALASTAATLATAEPTPPAAPEVTVPIVSSDEAVQKELRELDRLLDTSNLKVEETLRQNIDRLGDEKFRQSHPDIDVLLKQRPGIVPALKSERHFLIHRYVAHRARGPLLRADVVALDEFLDAHPEIRQALDREPSQILEPDFLMAHPSLGRFFDQHPSLGTILLKPKGARSGPKDKSTELRPE